MTEPNPGAVTVTDAGVRRSASFATVRTRGHSAASNPGGSVARLPARLGPADVLVVDEELDPVHQLVAERRPPRPAADLRDQLRPVRGRRPGPAPAQVAGQRRGSDAGRRRPAGAPAPPGGRPGRGWSSPRTASARPGRARSIRSASAARSAVRTAVTRRCTPSITSTDSGRIGAASRSHRRERVRDTADSGRRW